MGISRQVAVIGGAPIVALIVFIYSFGWLIGIASAVAFYAVMIIYLVITDFKFEEHDNGNVQQ